MNHYGLHFTADDGKPLQVRIGAAKRDVWARSCPNGEWNAWRRLDVERGADGVLNETCLTANNAKLADAASRLAYPITITLNGDVDGSCRFDGASSVVIQTSATAIAIEILQTSPWDCIPDDAQGLILASSGIYAMLLKKGG